MPAKFEQSFVLAGEPIRRGKYLSSLSTETCSSHQRRSSAPLSSDSVSMLSQSHWIWTQSIHKAREMSRTALRASLSKRIICQLEQSFICDDHPALNMCRRRGGGRKKSMKWENLLISLVYDMCGEDDDVFRHTYIYTMVRNVIMKRWNWRYVKALKRASSRAQAHIPDQVWCVIDITRTHIIIPQDCWCDIAERQVGSLLHYRLECS